MNIVHILPELDVGGVETHVAGLAEEQLKLGHRVAVVSAGGRMVSRLPEKVSHITMAVDRKNPFTAALCALRLARMARRFGWTVIHAHSRVPAWIGWWASSLSHTCFVVTCHSLYSLNAALFPYRLSDGAVCVSDSVKAHQKNWLPGLTQVIRNGIKKPKAMWTPKRDKNSPLRFLFVGRLTEVKGADFLIPLFASLADLSGWTLDIGGLGPLEKPMKARAAAFGIGGRVRFLGYLHDAEGAMARCDCCLFPSRSEGAGLALMSALAMGVPVLASDVPAFGEIMDKKDLLPLKLGVWNRAVRSFIARGPAAGEAASVRTLSQMAADLDDFYLKAMDCDRI